MSEDRGVVSKVDLHIHSTVSDGRFSPEEIIRKAAELGLTVIALADHDSVGGIMPALKAAKAFPWLKVIPCVEISTDISNGEVHVLGYFIDYTNRELRAVLERFRSSRRRRAQGMITKLADLGINVEWRRVQEIASGDSIGRPHIAQAMMEKGYINSLREAFTKYIGQGGPAHVEREKLTPVEAVELIVRANGLPVLAHPFTTNNPEAMVIELKEAGLIGIEAYSHGYTADESNKLISLADKYNLLVSGGSDYHGLEADNEAMFGSLDVPMESAERLMALAEQRAPKLTHP